MWDKTFFVLLILFMLVGVVTYDRYLQDRGEVGPVGQLMDYAGLSRFMSPAGTSKRISRESYQYNVQSHLGRLRKKHAQIEEQRLRMINNRAQILNRLMEINDHIQEEAEHYAKVLREERQRVNERFPELEELGQSIIENQQVTDTQARLVAYRGIRDQLLELFASLVKDPQSDLPRLMGILNQIESIVLEEEEVLLEGCEDWNTCLSEDVDELKEQLEVVVERIVEQPQRDMDKLLKLTNMLQREYKILSENIEASELRLQDGNDEIESELQALTQRLVAITEGDLKNLMQLYQELAREQDLLLENLSVNRSRFLDSYARARHQSQQIIQSLRMAPRFTVTPLAKNYRVRDDEQKGLLTRFDRNERKITIALEERQTANVVFISDVAKVVNIDIRKLMDDRRYLEEKQGRLTEARMGLKPVTPTDPERKYDIQSGSNMGSERDRLLLERAQQRRIQQKMYVDDQMQKMRDKARDQGFFE